MSTATKTTATKPKPKPKQPQDRKPKATKAAQAPDSLIANYLDTDWEISRESLDDFELLEALDDIENGGVQRIPGALRRLLGADQYLVAKDKIRGDDGRISVEAGLTFFAEIFSRADAEASAEDDSE